MVLRRCSHAEQFGFEEMVVAIQNGTGCIYFIGQRTTLHDELTEDLCFGLDLKGTQSQGLQVKAFRTVV